MSNEGTIIFGIAPPRQVLRCDRVGVQNDIGRCEITESEEQHVKIGPAISLAIGMFGGDCKSVKARLLVLIGLAILSAPLPLPAVDCTPDSITLSSESEVDDSQADHGPCGNTVGKLTLSGGDIIDLFQLSGITTAGFGSTIPIQSNTILTKLDGLSGLTSARWVEIIGNDSLARITGLSGIVDFTAGVNFTSAWRTDSSPRLWVHPVENA